MAIGDLIDSLKEHGHIGPIVYCQLNWLPDKPVIPITHKREFYCRKFNIEAEEKILEAKTVDDYLRYCSQFKEPILSTREKKAWINYHAEILYSKANFKPGEIAIELAKRFGVNIRTVHRWLRNEYKDKAHQRSTLADKVSANKVSLEISKSKTKLISEIRREYDFLTEQEILEGIKKPLNLLKKIQTHYENLRVPSVHEMLSKATIDQLMDVLYSKLETSEFSKQDTQTMLFWKYLAEEYNKRYSDVSANI